MNVLLTSCGLETERIEQEFLEMLKKDPKQVGEEIAMEKLGFEAKKILDERFGKDTIIALATMDGNTPCVRNVNAYYEEGTFYIITYGLSNKM